MKWVAVLFHAHLSWFGELFFSEEEEKAGTIQDIRTLQISNVWLISPQSEMD